MTPTAVLILKGERVELFSIKNAAATGTVDKVLNMVPEVISHFKKKKEDKKETEAAEKETAAKPETPAEEAVPEPVKTETAAEEKTETEKQ